MKRARRVLGLFGKGLAVTIALLVTFAAVTGGLVAGGVVVVGAPTVDDVETTWGSVDEDSTEMEAAISVDNPNPVGVPRVMSVEHEVLMNDVTVSEGSTEKVGLSSGSTDLDVEMEIDNDRIVDWWVTHVNNGGKTALNMEATVEAPGYTKQMSVRNEVIETDALAGISDDRSEPLVTGGEQVAVVNRIEAKWGEADRTETPITVEVTVENTNDSPVTIGNLQYSVGFNDVEMGAGTDSSSFTLSPGERRTVSFTMTLDTGKVKQWWVTHVENDERTLVQAEGWITVTSDGSSQQVRIETLTSDTEMRTSFVVDRDDG